MTSESGDSGPLVELRARVDRLELLIVRAGMVATWVLLTLGVLLDFATFAETSADSDDGRSTPVALSVLTFPFRMVGELGKPESAGDDDLALGVAIAIGFLGLLVVVAIAAFALAAGWNRLAGGRTVRVLRLAAILSTIGTGVVWIFGLMAASADDKGSALHPIALILLSAGVLSLFGWVSRAGRDWWSRR